MVFSDTVRLEPTAGHITVKMPINILTAESLLIFYMGYQTLFCKIIFEEVMLFIALQWHTIIKDLLLSFLICGYDSFNKVRVKRILRGQPALHNLVKLLFKIYISTK